MSNVRRRSRAGLRANSKAELLGSGRENYDTHEAAMYLEFLSAKTLMNWRSSGSGPRYVKLGDGRVYYRRAALDDFLQQQEITPNAA